jgi:hypothetical protein
VERLRDGLDPLAIVISVMGIAGLVWLGPLMFDQLVFFADREQTRQAAASRTFMLPAAALLVVASAGIGVRGLPLHALLASLPALVAVPLALLAPGPAYQLLAYVITAPVSLGALQSAAVSLRAVPTRWLIIGVAIATALALIAESFLALMVPVATVVWWRLQAGTAETVTAPHRR